MAHLLPNTPLDIFIEKRIKLFIEKIKEKLTGIKIIDIIDTKESGSEEYQASEQGAPPDRYSAALHSGR